eukprot:scaffold276757_cov20-Tisochrysis_lutea.AAC.2
MVRGVLLHMCIRQVVRNMQLQAMGGAPISTLVLIFNGVQLQRSKARRGHANHTTPTQDVHVSAAFDIILM